MRKTFEYLKRGAAAFFRGVAHILSDDFKQAGAHRYIEALMIFFLYGIYWYGLSQIAHSTIGFVVATAGAALLVMLFMVFIHNAFRGQSQAARWSSRIGVAVFITFAALMTSTLVYQTTFVTGYADKKAFDAVHTLTLYANQSSNAFAVANSRYRAAATRSRSRADTERSQGGTCNDASGKGRNGPRNIWRDSFATQMTADAEEISTMET